jgi:hypothetical protein
MPAKEKRRGGVQDESIIYINYTQKQLARLFSCYAKKKTNKTQKKE